MPKMYIKKLTTDSVESAYLFPVASKWRKHLALLRSLSLPKLLVGLMLTNSRLCFSLANLHTHTHTHRIVT